MASTLPNFQTLITVADFRKLVNEYFEEKIAEGQAYDSRDIQRFNEIDEYALMFIQHGQFDVHFNQDRALRIFHGVMRWRKRNNIYDISTNAFPADYFDRHAIYYKHHDNYYNSILHFVVRALNKGHEDNEAIKRFITYNFEEQIRKFPAQKIVILFDMSETGIRHLDHDLVKYIIASVQNYYPGLLAYMLIYKMPFLLSAAWKLIRTWIATEAEQFVKFVDTKSITEYISPDQLSKSMGGTANDK